DHVHVAGANGVSIDVEGGAISSHLGVLVGPIGIQRRLGAVGDLTAVLDVEQSAHLKLPVMERAPDAAGPAWVRVADDALRVVEDGLAVRVAEIGALGSSSSRMVCSVRDMYF